MRRSRSSSAVLCAGALAVAWMIILVGTLHADARVPDPSPSTGSDCEITDRTELRLTVGPGRARGYAVAEGDDLNPAWLDDVRDQTAAHGPGDRLDLVTGTELPVAASVSVIETGHTRSIAVTSVEATMDLGGAPPIWLATYMRDDGSWVIRMPTAEMRRWRRRITGEGILAARIGLCDGSSQGVYGRVLVVGPGSIADCPATWDAVWPYVERLDLRVRVGRSTVPGRDINDAHGRYNDPPPFVASPGALEGLRYRPASPAVRVGAGEELHVRHIDRDIDLVEPFVEWLDPPPARQLRDGLVNWNVNPRKADVRPDGFGGYRVTAPRAPGRYLLQDDSTWMNHCVELTEGSLLVMVDVR
jgi:hypothetical protein